MLIEWKIEKKRGNFRPLLTYSIELEDYEKALAVPQVTVESTIPKPLEDWKDYCYPGQFERNGKISDLTHYLHTPSHRSGSESGRLRLPWRADNEYPEVEASFRRLRADFETVMRNSYDSSELDETCGLSLSDETRKHVAAGVVADRLLKAVGY